MKKNNTLWLLLLALCSIFAACKKDHPSKTELEKLPPATQTGANTFGCLLNGKAWVAQTDCKYLCDPAFKVKYDAAYGGYLGLGADWKNSSNNIEQRIDLVFDSSNYKLKHEISINNPLTTARFINYSLGSDCGSYEHYIDSSVIHIGVVTISHYDLQNGIISGTFEFRLTKPSCEPISVTNGRFDYKLF